MSSRQIPAHILTSVANKYPCILEKHYEVMKVSKNPLLTHGLQQQNLQTCALRKQACSLSNSLILANSLKNPLPKVFKASLLLS